MLRELILMDFSKLIRDPIVSGIVLQELARSQLTQEDLSTSYTEDKAFSIPYKAI